MSGPVLMGFPNESIFIGTNNVVYNRYGIQYLCEPKPTLLVAVNWFGGTWHPHNIPFADVYDLSGFARRWVEEGLFRRNPLSGVKHRRVDDDPITVASAIHLIAQKYK